MTDETNVDEVAEVVTPEAEDVKEEAKEEVVETPEAGEPVAA